MLDQDYVEQLLQAELLYGRSLGTRARRSVGWFVRSLCILVIKMMFMARSMINRTSNAAFRVALMPLDLVITAAYLLASFLHPDTAERVVDLSTLRQLFWEGQAVRLNPRTHESMATSLKPSVTPPAHTPEPSPSSRSYFSPITAKSAPAAPGSPLSPGRSGRRLRLRRRLVPRRSVSHLARGPAAPALPPLVNDGQISPMSEEPETPQRLPRRRDRMPFGRWTADIHRPVKPVVPT